MDVRAHAEALREALDYISLRLARAESLYNEIQKLRAAVENARLDLEALEAREGEPSLRELQQIIEQVENAQLKWDEFAARLGELWAPGRPVH
jgi:hypothetical protein